MISVGGFSGFSDYFCTMTFGEGLYAWRVFRGYSQSELAGRAKVVPDTVTRHERKPGSDKKKQAVNPPSSKTINKLADALGIKPEQFYTLPTGLPEQKKTLEDVFDDVRSLYGSGKYTKEQIQREALQFLLEIQAEEKGEQGN